MALYNGNFECVQCGRCCTNLPEEGIRTEDWERWEREKRQDIIDSFKNVKNPFTTDCIWLRKLKDKAECMIHHTKPTICQQHPTHKGTALKRGCMGFKD